MLQVSFQVYGLLHERSLYDRSSREYLDTVWSLLLWAYAMSWRDNSWALFVFEKI